MTKLYLTMPQPGETISEGVIVQWYKNIGDEISEGEAVCELETEKAVYGYESPFAGKLEQKLFEDGATVPVGIPIAIIETPEEKAKQYVMLGIGRVVEDIENSPSSPATAGPSPHSTSSGLAARGEGVKETPPSPLAGGSPELSNEIPEGSISSAITMRSEPRAQRAGEGFSSHTLKLSPYVRRRARELNLTNENLEKLANEDGRVTAEAVEKNLISKTIPRPYISQPCSPIRMRIAERMVYSKNHIPHAHTGLSVDMTNILEKKKNIKEIFIKENGSAPSLLTLLLPALINTIKKHPLVNASYCDDTKPHEIRTFNHINMGVAVGSPHGLVTPVIHECEKLDVGIFNKKLAEIVKQAESRNLPPEVMTGMTFLFNNFGYFGTTIGVQIVAHPLSTTLGMGAIEKRAVPVGDEIKIRSMADFVLAFDHRIMDGREAGLFLSDLKRAIENIL